jgi:ABC-type glycerol-3-phosphate transport system substrate-binding protein
MSDNNHIEAPTGDTGVTSGGGISRRRFLGTGATGALAVGLAPTLARYKSVNIWSRSATTTLTLMSWEPFGQSPEFPAWTKVTNEFMAANPSIKVKWTGWPFATFDTNVIAQAQAGGVDADVVMAPPEAASTLISKYNLAVPLQSITHSLGLDPIPAHQQFTMNGNLYALGVIDVCFALTYDKRLLKAAGINKAPATMDAWLDAVKATTKAPNEFGVALINTVSAQADWWNQLQNWCLPFGGVWATGTDLTINSPANIKGIEYWLELLNASGLKGTSETAIDKLVYSDRVATFFNVAAGLSNFKTLAPKLFPNLRSTPPPWPGQKAIARLHPLLVMKSSKNIEAAMKLVKFCVTPKNLYYLTVTNGYPIIPYSNFQDFEPGYKKYLTNTSWLPGFLKTSYVGEFDILGQYTYAYAQIGNIIAENVEKAVSGSATVSQALASAQAQAKESLHA